VAAKSRARSPRGAPRGAPSKPAPRAERFEMFAICAPGLEDVLEAEMRSLGLGVGKRDIGGVAFSGGSSALFRANLWLRTATRVIARVGDFHARLFDELERHSRKLAWSRFIDGGQPVRLRVSTSKSRLYHTGAVAQRIAEAMEKSTGLAPTVTSGGDDDEESGETPLVIVRLFRDQCTVSIDSSGALLHRRVHEAAHLIELLTPAATLRWDVSVGGIHHLPKRSGALLVTNSRRFSLSAIYAAWALSQAIGRPVRFGGRPDTAPIGPFLQRFGGLFNKPEEISGALRAGELVGVSAKGTRNPRHAGPVDPALIGAAVISGTPVYPVASMSTPFGRTARVEVGPHLGDDLRGDRAHRG